MANELKPTDGKGDAGDYCKKTPIAVIVLGASGDLASKKVLPAIYSIFKHGKDQLAGNSLVVGYSRTVLTRDQFYSRLAAKVPDLEAGSSKSAEAFKDALYYVSGEYSGAAGYTKLKGFVDAQMKEKFGVDVYNRVFYLALPPEKFSDAAEGLHNYVHSVSKGGSKLVVEKPFGTDTDSCAKLLEQIKRFWNEDEMYRIDHFLGKELVAALPSIKFGNPVLQGMFSNKNAKYVEITLYEDVGTEGRSGYFDSNGIIRDVMQNHMVQIFSLIAMDCPKSSCPKGIRDAKVELLKSVRPINLSEVLVGQYTASEKHGKIGYLDDPGVAKGSIVPTFAALALHIDNPTWEGVPFIFKCGKAMNEKKTEVVIHLANSPNPLFPSPSEACLTIRIQPDESISLSLLHKDPGLLSSGSILSTLSLNYGLSFPNTRIPDAYEALFIDVLNGNSSNFVRQDELECSWALFTPVLYHLDSAHITPEPYEYFSSGPASLPSFIRRCISSPVSTSR